MLKKLMTATFLFMLLIASSLPLRSQTRPRRVTQQASSGQGSTSTAETAPRRRGRGLLRILRGMEIGIGGDGVDSCTPSRDVIVTRPRRRL